MNPQHLIDYAQRDWQLLDEKKAEYWRERQHRLGPGEGVRVAEELRRWVRQIRPDWPTPADREADLAHHIRLGEMLRSVQLD